jgi:hypothetical protein
MGWLAGAGTVLAVLACYGTLAVVSGLSLLGVSLAVHEGAWAAAIGFFAVVALLGIVAGYRRHRVAGPLVIGAIGTALVLWAMAVSYDRGVEIAGFAGLIAAAVWDWRVKRGSRTSAPRPS